MCVRTCVCVCLFYKSKFSSLESTQDAVGWPAVLCLAAKGYHGLTSLIEATKLKLKMVLIEYVCIFSQTFFFVVVVLLL